MLRGPRTLSASTRPTAICSITSTPTVLRIVFLPILNHQEFQQLFPHSGDGLTPGQFIQAVERRRLVTLRQRRIIEYRIHEILYRPFQREYCLPDVQQLRGAFSDDVHAEEFLGGRIENQLQAARGVSANLASRNFAEVSHSNFVGNFLVCQLLFRLSDERNLWNRLNSVGISRAVGMDR